MRLTNLLALFVSASLVLMTHSASARSAAPPPLVTPTKVDKTNGTSLADVRSVKAEGVEENRAWYMPQAFIDWLLNLFKSSRLRELEKKVAVHHNVEEVIKASEITTKLEPLVIPKDFYQSSLNGRSYSKWLEAYQKNAVELFKSNEFKAFYGRLGKVEPRVDPDLAVLQNFQFKLGVPQTALCLRLAKASGNKKVVEVATSVEKAQYREWEASERTPKQIAVTHLQIPEHEVEQLLKSENMLASIMSDYSKYVHFKTFGKSMTAPAKNHGHRHGHGHHHR